MLLVSCADKAGQITLLDKANFETEVDGKQVSLYTLRAGDIEGFKAGVMASGNSSFKFLQNVYTTKNITEQGLSLALCLADKVLGSSRAAWRVHGGGFAGTIQAFVPNDMLEDFRSTIEDVYEPFLIKEGFIKRTPRGREATELAYRHLGKTPMSPSGQQELQFN